MRPLRSFFFFNDTATTEIYTLSLHDTLPISLIFGTRYPERALSLTVAGCGYGSVGADRALFHKDAALVARRFRSEEHTSELQSRLHLVCRLLLEKKKPMIKAHATLM